MKMKIEEYQALAMRTSTDGHDRILNGCMGLIGEAGEIVDIVKKWKFQSGDNAELPRDKLIDECGDVLWYCAELMTGISSDLAETYNRINRYYDQMSVINRKSALEITVMRLAAIVMRPMLIMYDQEEKDLTQALWKEVRLKSEVIGIMSSIRDILEKYCESSLQDAMQHNIEKLKKRYPDGFDPERSLHRNE